MNQREERNYEVDSLLEKQKRKHYEGILVVLYGILTPLGALLGHQFSNDAMIPGAFVGLFVAHILAKAIVK